MKCSDVRWRLNEFLRGETSPIQDDLIRRHLDICPDCALRLATSSRVDELADVPMPEYTSNITNRVLSYYPVSPAGMMMVRHLSWAFVASAGFAVGVFMFVRNMINSAPSTGLENFTQVGSDGLETVASQLTSNPLVNYIALAALAAILCVALIGLVDRPSPTTSQPNNHNQ